MVRYFLLLAVFPLVALPLYGAAVVFLGEEGILWSMAVIYAAAVCMAFVPARMSGLDGRLRTIVAISCMVLAGVATVHMTASSIEVADFEAFAARATSVPLFLYTVLGSIFWFAAIGLGYFALLSIVPRCRRWAQWGSVALFACAALFSVNSVSNMLVDRGLAVDFLQAIWAKPYERLSWIFLLLILIFKITTRYILAED